jgi:DNA-binding IclR family transcriptional regulator
MELAKFRHPTTLKTLSARCQLTPSKVHRYLSSLGKLGLVFQGTKSGTYSLGRNAILIGLAAMQQSDQVDDVIQKLPGLVGEIGHHVFLSVWSKAGPTIIKWEWADDPLVVGWPLGQALPVSHSASGRVFAAFLKSAVTRDLLAQERSSYGDKTVRSDEDLQSIVKLVRERRFAISRGEVESEVTTIAVPVVDWEDNPSVVVAAAVSKHTPEDKVMSIAERLLRFSHDLSVPRPSFPFET